MTALSTLAANNAGFGNILKTIQSGGAYIDPRGRVLSKTALKPITGYSNTLDIRGVAHAYDENGSLIEIPREPLQLYKFDVAGDGKFTIPKLRNEKDGGYYADITLNATKDGGNFTLEDKDTTAAGKYFKATKGTDYSNQQWTGMSRGLANITNAVQTGEATVDSKKSIERWDDGQGNEGSREYYALRDGNGTEVGALYDVPGRPDLRYAKNVGNETAGGSHDVYLQVDPKSGAVAPIQDWSKQVTYNESQGKTFWQQQKEAAVAFAPLAAMIFAPAAGAAIGTALMEAGVLTSASAAAASATTAAQAASASAAATATATAVGTGIANATVGILQGKPVDQAIGDAAVATAIQIGTPAAVGDIKNQIAQITSNPSVSNILTNATVSAGTALLKGKNAVDAFEKGGTNALVNQIGLDIPGFADMNATAKKVVTDAIKAGVSGKDFKLTPEYMVNTLISTANKTANNTQKTNEKFEDTFGRQATEEELSRFATVENEDELDSSFAKYMADATAKSEAEAQAKTDEANNARVKAWQKAQDDDAAAQEEADRLSREAVEAERKANDEAERLLQAGLIEKAAQVEADRLAREKADSEASAKQAAIDEQNRLDEAERLRQAGLQEKTDVDLNKVVGGEDTTTVTGADTLTSEAADDTLPVKNESNLSLTTKETDVVGDLTNAGLHDDFDTVDLTKVVGGEDTVTGTDTLEGGTGADTVTEEDAEQARRVAEFGKDLANGGVQDLGVVNTDTDFYDENSTGMGAYKYDPISGTYTYTSDDGSTLILDGNGDIVGFTESTHTGNTTTGTGNTTTGTGNTATGTGTTTTGTGTTAVTTGTGNTAITTGSNTAVVTGSGTTALNSDQILSLLNVFGGSGGQQQQQVPYTPAQVPVADIKSYYNTIRGIAGENLLPESKEEKDKSNIDNLFAGGGTVNKSYDDVIRGIAGENLLDQPKEKKEKSSVEEMFFEGGTVDDLLRILRS